MLSRDEARAILQKALAIGRTDEAEATLTGSRESNIRFARNVPTTTGRSESMTLTYTAVIGRQVGAASTSELDADGLSRVVRQAEALARLAPESPEYMPRLGAQTYIETPGWDAATTAISSDRRAEIARAAIRAAHDSNVMAAGFYQHGESFTAVANRRGLLAYHRATSLDYSLTMRREDGNGSGWAAGSSHRPTGVNPESIVARAVTKARHSVDPVELEPGAYPVVLEASCTGDLLQLLYWNLGRRAADEGRSFFSGPNNRLRLGEKLFADGISIYSDPADQIAPSVPWGDDGLPLSKTTWIENGVLKNLGVGRYWGERSGIPVLPLGTNIIMKGGSASLDDLIDATDYGLLVTSFWYIRGVDPRTILHTGLTRDGLFLIEKGKITRPVVNFRWNESPASVFAATRMIGRAERVVTREGNPPMVAPPIKADAFRFTSVSPST